MLFVGVRCVLFVVVCFMMCVGCCRVLFVVSCWSLLFVVDCCCSSLFDRCLIVAGVRWLLFVV